MILLLSLPFRRFQWQSCLSLLSIRGSKRLDARLQITDLDDDARAIIEGVEGSLQDALGYFEQKGRKAPAGVTNAADQGWRKLAII